MQPHIMQPTTPVIQKQTNKQSKNKQVKYHKMKPWNGITVTYMADQNNSQNIIWTGNRKISAW